MSTITFNCPNCKYLCAFKDIFAGRRAKCLRCNQLFIIPAKSDEPAQKIEQLKQQEFDEPLEGFYEAVFKKSLPAIFNKQSMATLVFILVLTTLKFFAIHLDFSFAIPSRSGGTVGVFLPVGLLIAGFTWGGIFWCYGEIIYATAFDIESLPEITFGGGAGFFFSVLKSLYSFAMVILILLLPAIVFKYIFRAAGITSQWAVWPFIILAMFLLPMAVLTISITKDLTTLFRPDYFFTPIKKAFRHYLFLAGLFIIIWHLQYMSRNYGDIAKSGDSVILNLAAALAIQILAIFAMRVTGLFYRHFGCFFKW